MNSDEKYMRLAIEQAGKAKDDNELPFGAVIVLDDKVVAANRCREGKECNVTKHAELQAVDEACDILGTNNLSNCTIYATNEPCNMCAAAIFQAKIPRVVFAVARDELPHIFRVRKLGIEHLAEDSGYYIQISNGLFKDEVIEFFNDIKKT